jgi:AcrR family transcriptional regulator
MDQREISSHAARSPGGAPAARTDPIAQRARASSRRLEASLRRRHAVSDRIERVALEMMAERGYHAVTVEDVAGAAGVSSRTFFRHFACKDDVVLHLQRAGLKRWCHGIERRPACERVVTAVREAAVAATAAAADERDLLLLHARVLAGVPALQAQALGEHCAPSGPLVSAIAARMGTDPVADIRPALLGATVAAAAGVALARWAAAGGVDDPAVAVGEAVDVVIAGVGALVSQ